MNKVMSLNSSMNLYQMTPVAIVAFLFRLLEIRLDLFFSYWIMVGFMSHLGGGAAAAAENASRERNYSQKTKASDVLREFVSRRRALPGFGKRLERSPVLCVILAHCYVVISMRGQSWSLCSCFDEM